MEPGSGDSVTSLSGADQKNLPVKGTENGIFDLQSVFQVVGICSAT